MPIRSFNFPSDFRILEQLTLEAYQYPLETGWVTRSVQEQEARNFIDTLRAVRRLWPLIAIGQSLSPSLRNIIRGFIWEEDDQPVGLVVTGGGANRTWWIANLAVLSTYRRRGIARQLVQAAMETARSFGGEAVTLDVIAENLPAYQLYQQLGFETYNGSIEFIAPNDPLPSIPTPPEYLVYFLKANEWQPHFQLAAWVTPADIQKYRPVTVERFEPPLIERWVNRIIEPAAGISRGGIAIYWHKKQGPCAAAQFTARTRSGGVHELNVRIDPAHSELAPFLLCEGISRVQCIHPGHPVHIHIYSWQESLVLAAQKLGCIKSYTYYTMGMKLK